MKPVVQLERTGCGIAAVAAIAGVSYRKAQRTANRLAIFAKDRRLWSETAHVCRLLEKYRLRTASNEQPFRSWSSLPDLAVLAIKWHREQGRPCWYGWYSSEIAKENASSIQNDRLSIMCVGILEE